MSADVHVRKAPLATENPEYKAIVKAADILQAYVKTKNELRFHNNEFEHVKQNLDRKLAELEASMPEVKCFIEIFLDSCTTTLDKISEVQY